MVEPLLYQSPSSFFQFTSSLLPVSSSLLPIHFQSTSSFHPDSSQLPRVHFCVIFFSFYELWANNDGFGQYILFWLMCLKPYCLKDRYHCRKKNNLTNGNKGCELPQNLVEPLLNQSPSSFIQFTSCLLPVSSVYFQSTSSLLPVFIQLLGVHLCVKFSIFY